MPLYMHARDEKNGEKYSKSTRSKFFISVNGVQCIVVLLYDCLNKQSFFNKLLFLVEQTKAWLRTPVKTLQWWNTWF